MPRLMPNENAILYGKETLNDASRQKRAIPLGLIFSGVSAIGGLIMKGVNKWSNYKKSKAMTKAVEKLYEAQEIDHRQLTRLEGQTSLFAKTTKTAFKHIDYRLLHLDTKLNSTVQHMTEFFKRTETHFRFTWEALVSNRLAIHLLSSGSAMYDMVLRQYLNYYQNYDVTLDHFLTGLDALGTGRLTFQVLDPDELDRFLGAIRRQLREERSPFELAFNHTYQFYAEPMVMFTNTHDQLLVNVPILLRLATQKPLNLYSIDTVPMPFDTETLDGKNNEYTFINNSYPYMALNEHNYIPLTETQLRMCDKMGSTYYCQNSYVLRQRTQHTCESAIYYKMDAKMITKHCQAKFAANVEFTPKVLDVGETMVLFNLPRPWILLCGHEKQPTEINFATYKVVDRKEFCECSLTAGSFQLDETLVKCTPEINSEADGRFKSYFAINKIIFDYLQAEKDVQLDSTVVQALSRLLDVKPEYDWMPLNWYVYPDLPDTVINKQPSSVIADLKVPCPTYKSSPLHSEPDIIHATDILIEERIDKISTMIRKSVSDFHAQLKEHMTELTKRIKRATTKADYGFVRKPELRHQYGMLFNHHGQVISGLKNMDLFLSIDLPKLEDIAHDPPPFPECDNWATPHKSNHNHHVYFSAHGFGRDNHGPMTELNTNTSEYLAEAIHITVCNQYRNKYVKLLERIETIK